MRRSRRRWSFTWRRIRRPKPRLRRSGVRALVRKEGLRYREIGVIASDMSVYGSYLKRAFARYDIPVFLDQKRSILLNSFVEYIRSLLAMAEEGFTCDSVFRFLRSGYAPFPRGDLEELENYCLALGIRGYRKWQQRWRAPHGAAQRRRIWRSSTTCGSLLWSSWSPSFLCCGSAGKRSGHHGSPL